VKAVNDNNINSLLIERNSGNIFTKPAVYYYATKGLQKDCFTPSSDYIENTSLKQPFSPKNIFSRIFDLLKTDARKKNINIETVKVQTQEVAAKKNISFKGRIAAVDANTALKAAQRVTSDKEIQDALVRLSQKEGIVIRTKQDAFPILREQYESLSERNKKNLYILNINPQSNNGMPKSNTLISKWYAEANGINHSKIITLSELELSKIKGNKQIKPSDICKEWAQGNKTGNTILSKSAKIKPSDNDMTTQNARILLEIIANLEENEIFKITTVEEIAKAINKINNSSVVPARGDGGYTAALAKQIQEIIESSDDEVNLVIPDDCSLSGSSIICDTARIVAKVFADNDCNKKVNFIFSPMIYGDKAEKAINLFSSKAALTDENYLVKINAVAPDGSEKFKGARKVFETIQNLENVNFQVSESAKKAVHFTETETFKQIGQENPELQQKLLYIMQGPASDGGHLYGGFGDCGVMVITPTETFEIDGKKYAGKVPTNSVGFMEALAIEAGVLNDELPDDIKGKGLFIKGTGRGYSRYIEWDKLAHPSSREDRIPIVVKNGKVRKAF